MSETHLNLSATEAIGLLPEELDRIEEILGRKPNPSELNIFAVMWAEDCSCKNSVLQLKTLPMGGEKGVGLLDLGNGYVLAFDMKSQPQTSKEEVPSAIGGIHGAIMSKGARPIASLNSLCLGEAELPETQALLKGISKSIEDYGNSSGVPMLGGDVYFNSSYNNHPLINAMSIGILKKDTAALAPGTGIGNGVFIASSGKGAFDSPAEKRLLEATLEGLQNGAIAGIRHIGHGGIACATAEMAAEGKVGMEIWVENIPQRQERQNPFDRLFKDSKRGILLELEKCKEDEIQEVFEKWDLEVVQIGVLTDSGMIQYKLNGDLLGEIPAEALVQGGGAPVYEREQKEPAYMAEIRAFDPQLIIEPIEHERVIRHLLEQVSIAAKKWGIDEKGVTDKEGNLPSDAAFLRIPDLKAAILLSADCNARYVQADPEKGAMLAVAKAARNIACAGGVPRAVSNSLNFGNPYDPEVYHQFAQTIKGIRAACQQFNTPVSGGNVSLYNESESGPILPTPLIGMLGSLEDAESGLMSMHFKAKGDQIYLLGKMVEDFGSSEYVYSYHQKALSPAPYINLEEEQKLQQILGKLIAEKAISSAHSLSEGGLIISMLESAFVNELGFSLRCPEGIRKDAFLYGESGGRAVVSVSTAQLAKFVKITASAQMDALHLGTVAGDHMVIDGEKMDEIQVYKRLHKKALEKKLGFSLSKNG